MQYRTTTFLPVLQDMNTYDASRIRTQREVGSLHLLQIQDWHHLHCEPLHIHVNGTQMSEKFSYAVSNTHRLSCLQHFHLLADGGPAELVEFLLRKRSDC